MDGRTITSAGAASRWATRRPRNPTAAAATAGASGHPIVALDVAEALPRAVADLLS